MATSLATEFLSGGFSIQRNEMVSMQQQKHRQKFQFLNSFNQTYTRLDRPAQGEFDRIRPYSLSSEKRQFIGGTVTTVTTPLTQTYRNGNQKAQLGGITLNSQGGIVTLNVLSGGYGYAPSTTFNVIFRGGQPDVGTFEQCYATAQSDGEGRIVSVDIQVTGLNYDETTGAEITAEIDESPTIGQFYVSFFDGVGAITGVDIESGNTGHRPGVYFVEAGTVAVGVGEDGVTPNASAGSGGTFQVHVDNSGAVIKVVPLTFGQDYLVGNEITIPATRLGNNGTQLTPVTDLVISVSSVVDADQFALDYGTVTWRSETFQVGDTVVLEYFIDTSRDTRAVDGVLRTLATDLCLHPYGNYYSSAFSTVQQRNAVLTWDAAPTYGVTTFTATLTDAVSGFALTADTGFQPGDVGKRIIEPNKTGAAKIISVDAAGVATVTMDNVLEPDTREVNAFESSTKTTYSVGEWRLAIATSEFESQPYNIIYPYLNSDATSPIPIAVDGQQNHRDVKTCINRIGDMFIVESEKATDLLSSKADINSATSAIPSSVSLTQPVKDARKPQKWRMRFFYDQRDEYLYVNIATSLQIKDNGDLTKGQGRDGIKQAVFRQPGELSEIYYNFSNDTNKAKSGWFRRQGKTTDDIESGYPLAYRLTCTDHGTGLFLFDQASVDQDDDYAWFVVQRHVNNVSGRIEFEDGKSPVHCLYSPSTRPEETSNYNVGFFAEVDEDLDVISGQTTITSKSLEELQIYDVNGRLLKPGLPVDVSIVTDSSPVEFRTTPYSGGPKYLAPTLAAGGVAGVGPYDGISFVDTATLGTDSTTGYTIINDQVLMPAITGGATGTYEDLAISKSAGFTGATITDRTQFSLNFAKGYGTTFVPVGQFITALEQTNRFTANVDEDIAKTAADIGDSRTVVAKAGFTIGGLDNFNAARNQMTGPARLGLTPSRIRHRSRSGVDTYLEVSDFQFLDKTEIAPRVNPNGKARELPVVSSVAIFKPLSGFAKNLVNQQRVRIIHVTPVTATYSAGSNIPVIALQAAGSITGPVTGLTDDVNAEIVPIPYAQLGGSTAGFITDYSGLSEATPTNNGFITGGSGFTDMFITAPGSGTLDMAVGDMITTKQEAVKVDATYLGAPGAPIEGYRVDAIVDTFSEGDGFIYEYAWEGAGFGNTYTNFYGRSGTSSNPLFEVNRLKIFVDGAEADAAVFGQNYTINSAGEVEFGTTNKSLEYFGVEKPMYAYNLTNDTWTFNEVIENGTVVKLSYENYNDIEERDTGKSTYLIKVPEDRDIPSIWNDIHRVAKGIYRFCVREADVFKPWDYHVSAVIPQVDSPACINPVEQLSITQDKTVIFNFPTPLASQRFIYSDAEMDLICVAGADSSTQGGIIKTASTKYDLDAAQISAVTDGHTPGTENISSNGDKMNFRQPYDWHNTHQGVHSATLATNGGVASFRDGAVAVDTISNSTHRTYVGMMSTKPFGNGMRIFILTRGGPVRPQYSDYTPRDIRAENENTFT